MARRPNTQEPLRFEKHDPWNADEIRGAWEKRERVDGDASMAERIDDYVNRLTGIGDYLQDKSLGGSRFGLEFMVRFISAVDAEDRWRGSDVGGAIVEAIPGEMTREGWEVSVQPSDGDDAPAPEDTDQVQADAFGQPGGSPPPQPGVMPPELTTPTREQELPDMDDDGAQIAQEVSDKFEELMLDELILDALCYERAFGGAAILIGADDGKALDQPLDEEKIKSVDFLNVFQGGIDGEIVAWSYYRDPKSAKYGKPEIYMVRNVGVPTMSGPMGRMGAAPGREAIINPIDFVHESRLMIFPGRAPSRRARIQMRGWGDSIFMRVDEVLSQFSQTWGGLATLMTDFKQDVLSVAGAPEKLAADRTSKGNPLVKRARTIQQTRSILRMLVIDKDKESFAREMAQVSGVADVLSQFWLRLASAAGMPLSLLTGQVKGGLGDAGQTDVRFFYDKIAAQQRRVIVPQVKKLARLIFLSKEGPTSGAEPERWSVKCRPLYQLDALQEAQRRLAIAQTDHIYITDGVLAAPEVAASAFGGSEFTAERTIDIEGRRNLANQEEADRQERMKAAVEQLSKAAPTQPGSPVATAPGAEPPKKPGATDKVE